MLIRPGCCVADHEGLQPHYIHTDGHVLMCGGQTHCFKQPQAEVWLKCIVKAHVKKMHGTATPAHLEEEPKGMVVTDA